MNASGEHIVFLISAPRSGSSMTQQLMISHPEINSAPEPYFMLPLLGLLETDMMQGHYEHDLALNGIMGLFETHGLRNTWDDSVKTLALDLYNKLKTDQFKYFLDKTPRYYHIIPQLKKTFPEAKFIILARNPISVFASLLGHNMRGSIDLFTRNTYVQNDIFLSFRNMVAFHKANPESLLLRYEDIVSDPVEQLKKVADFLNIPQWKDASYEVEKEFSESNRIDNRSLTKHKGVVTNYVKSWMKFIDTPQKKQIALDYLRLLGADIHQYLGYDMEASRQEVAALKLRKTQYRFGLDFLIKLNEKDIKLQLLRKLIFKYLIK